MDVGAAQRACKINFSVNLNLFDPINFNQCNVNMVMTLICQLLEAHDVQEQPKIK